MKYFTKSMSLMGTVTDVNPADASFTLRCRRLDFLSVPRGVAAAAWRRQFEN